MLNLQKTNYFLSFHSRFFILKFINVAEIFLRKGGGDNPLKRTYVVEGLVTCKTNRRILNEILSESTF